MPEEPADAEIPRLEERYARHPDSLVFARLADAYRKGGDPDRALELVEEGLARHPDYLSARVVRARVLRDLGESDRAARAFESVLDVDPLNLVALRALTEMAERRGDEEEVRRWGMRLAEAEPLDPGARKRLERLERKEREEEPVSSDETVSKGEGDPVVPEREDESAASAAGEGEGEAAAEPDDGTPVTATMAELYMTQGLYEEALRIYRRLLERRPGDPVLVQKAESARILSGQPRGAAPAEPAEPGPSRGGEPRRDGRGEDAAAAERAAAEAERAAAEAERTAAAAEPTAAEPEDAAARPEAAAGAEGDTIRRWLLALLDGSAEDFLPARPRPTALESWLDRSRAG